MFFAERLSAQRADGAFDPRHLVDTHLELVHLDLQAFVLALQLAEVLALGAQFPVDDRAQDQARLYFCQRFFGQLDFRFQIYDQQLLFADD